MRRTQPQIEIVTIQLQPRRPMTQDVTVVPCPRMIPKRTSPRRMPRVSVSSSKQTADFFFREIKITFFSLGFCNTLSSSDVLTRPESPVNVISTSDYDSSRVLSCHNHFGQSLRFYCDDCETAICVICNDIGHRDHSTRKMSEAVESEKNELRLVYT